MHQEYLTKFRIGVIGYSSQAFDEDTARRIFLDLFKEIKLKEGLNVEVVSGLTWMGIPGLAYEIATAFDWETVGIAPTCVKEFELFPCDRVIYVGDDWGEESDYFLDSIDVLIKIGGGQQSNDEAESALARGIALIDCPLEAQIAA